MKKIISILTIALLLAGCTANAAQTEELGHGNHTIKLDMQGRERTYKLHIPQKYDKTKPTPLVFVIHGGGGNADNVEEMSGFTPLSDSEGFIVCYPSGSGKLKNFLLTWNTCNCCGYAMDINSDDVGFFSAMIEDISGKINIDKSMIYATGISNGGMMSYLLGCRLSDKFAAVGPVAGALNCDCAPTNPISAIIFHGMKDEHVLYEGGVPKKQADSHPRVDKSVEYAVNFWATHNGSDKTPETNDTGNLKKDVYKNGKAGTEVVLYTIKDGGHSWPGGKKGYPQGDPPSQEINATKTMWEFFKAHPKKPANEKTMEIFVPTRTEAKRPCKIVENGTESNVVLSTTPEITDGATFMGFKDLAENLLDAVKEKEGYIKYDTKSKMIAIGIHRTDGSDERVEFWIGSDSYVKYWIKQGKTAHTNGKLSKKPYIASKATKSRVENFNKTMAGVRDLANIFGAELSYNQKTREIKLRFYR